MSEEARGNLVHTPAKSRSPRGPWFTPVIVGGLLVLLLDSGGAAAARLLDFSYLPVGLAAYGLLLMIGLVGGLRGRGLAIVTVGGITGFIHGTAGRVLSARFGPASVAAAYEGTSLLGLIMGGVVFFIIGAVLGGVGLGMGRGWRRVTHRTGNARHDDRAA